MSISSIEINIVNFTIFFYKLYMCKLKFNIQCLALLSLIKKGVIYLVVFLKSEKFD